MWKNKNYAGKFIGNYELKKNGETHFHLISVISGKTTRFRSWQAAKNAGWFKVG